MAVPSLIAKTELRPILSKRRDDFVSTLNSVERASLESALAARVVAMLGGALTVVVYLPIGSEIGTRPTIAALRARGIRVALPHVTRAAGSLRFLLWNEADHLEPGPFGLRQPADDAVECVPDLVLTPLLGFDAQCNRIGYGAGYYDRAFARYPLARRIGLAWDSQRCMAIACDAWDVPLHAVATETDWIE